MRSVRVLRPPFALSCAFLSLPAGAQDTRRPVRFTVNDLLIRGEAFNLTNTPEFDNPDTNLRSPIFGKILTKRNH
jgi:hypothetical protein